ncbi:hypothetical protein [Actinomadura alba]|uniref:Uncharacterized protein n=1 Tax=Actinomadura alba TaxID=406431 RepID=A0ABR7LK46_9ACTN|nr:hypothetical protein [Actinomadura alba]MBC6465241.1 hypothetical protein [Actinomadura alba]
MRVGKRKLLTAGILSAAVVMITANPALADIGPTYSTDSNPGAGAYFYSSGDEVKVCDLKLDGLRARATLYADQNGIPAIDFNPVGYVDDTTTNGACVTKSINVAERSPVYIRVCRYNSSTGASTNCRNSSTGTA